MFHNDVPIKNKLIYLKISKDLISRGYPNNEGLIGGKLGLDTQQICYVTVPSSPNIPLKSLVVRDKEEREKTSFKNIKKI